MNAAKPYPPAVLGWTIWGLGALLYLIAFFQRVAPAVMTDQLMVEFALGAAALGNLSAFYFYSYVFMQIPTGILADRWGPRRLLTAGAAVGALGSLLFALAPTLFWANAGRLLVGASVSVAFVAMMKLAAHWFAPRQYGLATGMALFVGIVGGVAGGVPLRIAVEAFGWRPVMAGAAVVCGLLALLIWTRVRNDPADLGYASHAPQEAQSGHHGSIWQGVLEALTYRNVWIVLLAPIGVAGSVLTFAGLWGVPYFRQVHGLDTKTAALITSTLLISWALGGPVLAAWSERLGRRKPIYISCV
ncbi:MAG TPA: MFS transporter, partial [Rhodocyclaceae bacterium]|nr:MFS transporter [Rhodocyclaceae bacterium]